MSDRSDRSDGADAHAGDRLQMTVLIRMSTDEYGWVRSKRGWNPRTDMMCVGLQTVGPSNDAALGKHPRGAAKQGIYAFCEVAAMRGDAQGKAARGSIPGYVTE